MSERDVKAAISLAIGGRPDCRIFRNNVGLARHPDGSVHPYGLCPGSADLIGWRSVVVTPEMVGQRVAVFVAIETKAESGGKRPDNQKNFIEQVRLCGGLAGFARSVDEAEKLLEPK